ncbi:MAG: OadG family protein [Lachnospiraceae bacterium]|nr:OadG family protein [Lachnospiraceae bacterium]MBQ8877266.1 OadG family protein [Lachnospiraceae bacterium]
MKKIITLICCVLFSMLLLTGCASQEVNLDEAQIQQVEDNVKSLISLVVVELPTDASAQDNWTTNAAYSEADREVQLNLSKDIWEELQTKWNKENNLKLEAQSTYEGAISSYLKAEEENGTPTGLVDGYVYAPAEDGFTVTATLVTDVRNVEMVVLYDADMYITNVAFNPVYTVGENMERAALNTLLGMGTVFAVLILIMFIISSFSLISKFEKASANRKEKKTAKKADAVDNTIAQIIEKEETELADDLELVAVISAAIAAYEGSASTDGFVVRSIKKSNKRSWKSTLN